MTDLEYITTGLFTRFLPVTPQGETAWREMEAQGGAKVPSVHAKSVIDQLRKAGYSVRKARRVTDKEIENIMKELES